MAKVAQGWDVKSGPQGSFLHSISGVWWSLLASGPACRPGMGLGAGIPQEQKLKALNVWPLPIRACFKIILKSLKVTHVYNVYVKLKEW